jgi:hypothetical protein
LLHRRKAAAFAMLALAAVTIQGRSASAAGAEPAAGAFASEFKDPDATFRPKYRWWLPLAATDDQELRNEVRQVAENGGGGLEAAAFPITGYQSGSAGTGNVNWGVGNSKLQEVGWGTPAWAHKTEVMVTAARDNGVSIDMTIGPLWPSGVPDLDEIDDPRGMQQLVFAQQYIPAGTQRTGALPVNNAPALPTVSRTSCAATAPGATNLPIANDVGGFAVGDEIVVGSERVTITQKGSAGSCTTLSAAAATGATNIKVGLATQVADGETITIGTGATAETVTIVTRGTTGAIGTGITFTPALVNAHANGEPVVQRLGTGLTVSPALQSAHAFGESVVHTADSTLVAVLVGRCSVATCNTQTTGSRLLDRATIQDVTSLVDASGNLTWTAPDDGGTWNVIAFRQTSANQTSAAGGSLNTTTAAGTIYSPDHLSKAGAKATTDFFDSDILTPATQQAIRAIGRGDLFDDSLELAGNLKWTWDMVAEWKARRGYDPITSLPALTNAGRQGNSTTFYDFTGGTRVRADYRQLWSDLYIANRLTPLREWAHSRGLGLRAQPYGEPIDSAEAGASLDTPEGESFGFGNNIERYKTVFAGANFRGRTVKGSESHASNGNVWNTVAKGSTGTSDLFAFYRGMAGGVTSLVYHGFPYLDAPQGTGAMSQWPGFSFGGNTSFSEAWGPRMPQWEDYGKVNDNIGRLQLILREGKPRFDVGVYWQQFATDAGLLTSTSPLHQNGFTNDYVSPAFLRDQTAQFEDGRLFKDQWGFKALVLNNQAAMPVDVAQKLVALAKQGLPVVIIGTPPSASPGAKDPASEDAAVQAAVAELITQPSVKTAAALADVPAALSALGVSPALRPETAQATAPILSVRRQTADVDYYFLHNQTNTDSTQALSFSGEGAPYRLDTWAGTVAPIASYSTQSGRVTVPVRVAANNVAVIAITKNAGSLGAVAARGPNATATTAQEAVYDAAGNLAIRSGAAGTYTTTLSDGRAVTTSIDSVAAALPLTGWTLNVDAWDKPESGKASEIGHTALGPIAVTANAAGALPAWTSITPANGYPVDLSDVSGMGTYTTTLTLPNGVPGAHLDLGAATDTVALTVNGRSVSVDQQDIRRIDLGGYLRSGENTIAVRVSSTLLNAVRATPGTGAQNRARSTTYGLTGPVTLTPYGQAVVHASTVVEGPVGGTVPATLSLALGTPGALGAFQPGVDRSYDASTTADVISTAGDATLSVSDPSGTATGRLVNGSFALSEPLQARANAGAFAPLSTVAGSPLSLLTYAGPVSNDRVSIAFRQHIGSTQALRTGAYSKTLTFTLSTTTP